MGERVEASGSWLSATTARCSAGFSAALPCGAWSTAAGSSAMRTPSVWRWSWISWTRWPLPRLINDVVLHLGRADEHELGQFNVELNLAPRRLQGRVLHDSERELAQVLDACRARVEELGARLVAVGMLLHPQRRAADRRADLRQPALRVLCRRRMRAARHRPFAVRIIDGYEPVEFTTDSVAPMPPRPACSCICGATGRFAAYNAAQSGAQVAVAANSPYLLARQAWQETRIPRYSSCSDTPPQVCAPLGGLGFS